jgi:GntR family transcriptional regulator
MLRINPMDAVPIWKQIEEEIRRLIAVGAFGLGEAVPSVRDLSRDLRVNPATVAKAYQRLNDAGLLEMRRGEGTFVAQAPPPVRKPERRQALESAAVRYASVAATVRATREEALSEIKAALEKIAGDGDRRSS